MKAEARENLAAYRHSRQRRSESTGVDIPLKTNAELRFPIFGVFEGVVGAAVDIGKR